LHRCAGKVQEESDYFKPFFQKIASEVFQIGRTLKSDGEINVLLRHAEFVLHGEAI
jgi:hypothetical protein